MTTDDTSYIFSALWMMASDIPKHSQGLIQVNWQLAFCSLKGGTLFLYRWLERDYGDWFGDGTLPERTRLQRR